MFRPHFSTRLEDYCDGTQFSEHPLFSTDECGLQVMLYYDDVEVCNPLGSAATVHKLGTCIDMIIVGRILIARITRIWPD